MIEKIKNFIINPRIRFYYLSRLGLLNWMSDEEYIKKEYYSYTGKKLDLNCPKTFNEKLQWLKLHDRKDIYTIMVDKAEAKKYVANIIGKDYIIPTIGVYDRFDDIDFDELPNQFVIKCTHDSGGIAICKRKAELNIEATRKKINRFLKRKFYYVHREWPYKNVKPRIIIEQYMENKSKSELTDYKVMCFGGKAKLLFTCTDRFGDGLKVTFFDLKWNKMPFTRHYPSSNLKIDKPKGLKEMITLSERLAEGIPFVRIDWYEINGKLFFGECTFFPGAGLEEFSPEIWDARLGDLINLDLAKAK